MKYFSKFNPISALLILTAVSVLYVTSVGKNFVWDDHDIIAGNPMLSSIRFLPQLLVSEDTFPGISTGYYRPVTYLSFFIDHSLWGSNPVGFTITNILLHFLVSLSLYRLVKQLFNDERLALFAALIFAMHPVAAEAVDFHSGGRNTLLCALFILLSFICHLRGSRLISLLFFALALLSKEFALLLPLLLFIHDRSVTDKQSTVRTYLPFFGVAAAYMLLRSFVVNSNLLDDLQLIPAFITMPEILATYIKNFILPVNLKTIYPVESLFSSAFFAYLAALLLIPGIVYLLRKSSVFLFGIAMLFIFFLPVLNFIPIGAAKMADRHAYLSLMGFSLILAWLISLHGKKLSLYLLAALLVFYGATVVSRNSIWKNDFNLYTRMIADAPGMGIGYQNLGMHYYNNGDYTNALKYLNECYKRKYHTPESVFALAAINYELANYNKAIPILNDLNLLFPGNPQSYILLSRMRWPGLVRQPDGKISNVSMLL